jgi:hypothetical protein
MSHNPGRLIISQEGAGPELIWIITATGGRAPHGPGHPCAVYPGYNRPGGELAGASAGHTESQAGSPASHGSATPAPHRGRHPWARQPGRRRIWLWPRRDGDHDRSLHAAAGEGRDGSRLCAAGIAVCRAAECAGNSWLKANSHASSAASRTMARGRPQKAPTNIRPSALASWRSLPESPWVAAWKKTGFPGRVAEEAEPCLARPGPAGCAGVWPSRLAKFGC